MRLLRNVSSVLAIAVAFLLLILALLSSKIAAFTFVGSNFAKLSPRMSTLEATANTVDDNTAASESMHFGKFLISGNHIFFRSPLSAAFVNLRPIVSGHVLVVPQRVVPRLQDMTSDEYQDMWQCVRQVQDMLQKHYNATGFNVAVQDGKVAGQSVPHVHVHLLPRVEGDFERNDDVYDALQAWAPRAELSGNKPTLEVPEDVDRKDRTVEQMTEEAAIYKSLM